jgi:hypothetical protein
MIDLDRVSDGGTLLEASLTATLDGFLDADPATIDDILLAADWCAAMEFGPGDTEQAEAMARAVGFLMREHRRRVDAQRERELRRVVAERHGLRRGDKRVVDAVRRYMKERES